MNPEDFDSKRMPTLEGVGSEIIWYDETDKEADAEKIDAAFAELYVEAEQMVALLSQEEIIALHAGGSKKFPNKAVQEMYQKENSAFLEFQKSVGQSVNRTEKEIEEDDVYISRLRKNSILIEGSYFGTRMPLQRHPDTETFRKESQIEEYRETYIRKQKPELYERLLKVCTIDKGLPTERINESLLRVMFQDPVHALSDTYSYYGYGNDSAKAELTELIGEEYKLHVAIQPEFMAKFIRAVEKLLYLDLEFSAALGPHQPLKFVSPFHRALNKRANELQKKTAVGEEFIVGGFDIRNFDSLPGVRTIPDIVFYPNDGFASAEIVARKLREAFGDMKDIEDENRTPTFNTRVGGSALYVSQGGGHYKLDYLRKVVNQVGLRGESITTENVKREIEKDGVFDENLSYAKNARKLE